MMTYKDMKWLDQEAIASLKDRGFENSCPFHSASEALEHMNYLKNLDKDPSCVVSVAGVYHETYPRITVLFKYRAC